MTRRPTALGLICRYGMVGSIVLTVATGCGPSITMTTTVTSVRAQFLAPCRPARFTSEVFCGAHEVFENREARTGRRIPLNVIVLPALTSQPAPDPIFFLTGGPGTGAASVAAGAGDGFLQELRRDRDLVFVDQRGTGRSNRLACPSELRTIRACRQKLEESADLMLYTTAIAVEDLDDVRQALGYSTINLHGVSYGTVVALEYVRRYPRQVRSATLIGVITPAAKPPLQLARATDDAMAAMMADCIEDPACRDAYPRLADDFAVVRANIDRRRARIEVKGAAGASSLVSLSRRDFGDWLSRTLDDLPSASQLPLLIQRAARGNWALFNLDWPGRARDLPLGMYLTVTCSEFVATVTEEDIQRETADTLLGDHLIRAHMQRCHEWPRARIPATYYEPIRSTVPVLMLSGRLDATTPPRWGELALRSLPNGRQIIVSGLAHSYGPPCITTLTAEFIVRGTTRGLDTACTAQIRRPPFVIPRDFTPPLAGAEATRVARPPRP